MRFRVFSFLLVLILLSVSVAVADSLADVDVSSLSDSDLRLLYDVVDAELAARQMAGSEIMYQGMYIVGEHLSAGMYRFIGTGLSDWGDTFKVYESHDDYVNDERSSFYVGNLYKGEIAEVMLQDGQCVYVSLGAFVCRKNDVKPTWAK